MTIRSATPPPPAPAAPSGKRPAILPMAILVLLVIVVIGTGVAVAEGTTGPASYACMSVSHSGSTVTVTTTGLIHYVGTQYYISCNEGSPLPSGTYRSSCLTISPKNIPATIGVGASTEYYYFSSSSGSVTIHGVPAPTNNTEWITPAGLSLTATC